MFRRVVVALDGSVRAEAILGPVQSILTGEPEREAILVTATGPEPAGGYEVAAAGVVLGAEGG